MKYLQSGPGQLIALLLLGFSLNTFAAQPLQLEWDPNSESDLAGYNLYRSITSGSGYAQINDQLISTTSYEDFPAPGATYYYVVTAVNEGNLESGFSNEVSIFIAPIVTADAGPDHQVREIKPVTLSGSGSDINGDPIYFNWSQVSGPAVTLVDSNLPQAGFLSPAVSVVSELVFELSVTNDHGDLSSDQTTVTVRPNSPPVVSAGPPLQARFGQTVHLEGSASDPDGDPLSYSWLQIQGEPVQLEGSGLTASFIAPSVEGTLLFRLRVSDDLVSVDSTTQVDVSSDNHPPTAEAGPGQTVRERRTATLTGSGTDPERDPLVYSWSQVSGPPVAIKNADRAVVSFKVPSVSVDTPLVFELLVDDGQGGQATDQTTVVVTDNQRPTANAGPNQATRSGKIVHLLGAASDPDDDPLTCAWIQIQGETVQLTGSDELVASFTAPDSEDTLVFTMRVSDDELSDESATRVEVKNENQEPLADAGPDLSIRERRNFTLAGTASDPNGDTLTYSWRQLAGPTVALTGAESAQAEFLAPSVALNTELVFELLVADGYGGEASDQKTVTITNNRPPTAQAGPAQTADYGHFVQLQGWADDPDGDKLQYEWKQTEGTRVSLHGTLSSSPSFLAPENAETLKFRFTASDDEFDDESEVSVRIMAMNQVVLPMTVELEGTPFEGMFVGAAIANPYDQTTQILVSGLKDDGVPINSPLFSDELPAMGQSAFLTQQMYDSGEGAKSLLVEGTSTTVRGLFMTGDWSLSRVDGIGGELAESRWLVFPFVRQNQEESTLLYLYNAGGEEGTATLRLVDPAGQTSVETEQAVPPGGTILGTLYDLFGSEPQLEEGYLEVESTVPFKGFQLYGKDGVLAAVAGQDPQNVSRLHAPHFFVDANSGNTEIRLMSFDTRPIEATLKAYDDSSRLIGTYETDLEPRQLFVGDIREMFDLDPVYKTLSGHLDINLRRIFEDPSRVLGTVTFSSRTTLATLPLIPKGHQETMFLHVAESGEDRMFTGLSILNPGRKPAEVQVEVFDKDGNRTCLTEFTIKAGARLSDLLGSASYCGAGFDQVEGHFWVKSNEPVISFALFGDFHLNYLSALEGQH